MILDFSTTADHLPVFQNRLIVICAVLLPTAYCLLPTFHV
jgi:hypothetical protein